MPNLRTKRILAFTFSALRAMLMLALIAYTVVEYVEFNSQKEVLHLTLFSMFFLVSNFLVNIGRHKAVLGEDEKAQSLFFLAMFAMAAAMFELVDLGLDQVLKAINATSMQILHIFIAVFESLTGMIAVIMIYFALDRLLVFLRALTVDLKDIKIP
ncbi:hypothetical protein [Synechococcus sp. MIT S1220]|uniref:hypothetical protein n=1 Tax=Synechococcus sp. MIT S1220 TaxID=3082549 RepID=UPI0039AF0E84